MSASNRKGGSKREARDKMLRERQTARGLLTHATEYRSAAVLIVDRVEIDDVGRLGDPTYHNPFYYLCGHSLELSMKASLLAGGVSHQSLIDLGHDLIRCLDEMRRCHPDHSTTYDDWQPVIEVLNGSYATKEFEYRITGPRSWPLVPILLNVVEDFCNLAQGIVDKVEGHGGQ